jgi:hypothetical protein
MDPWKYYGIDWIQFVLILAMLRLLGKKKRSAWLVGVLLCCVSIWLGFLFESLAIVFMNIIFMGMHISNWFAWKIGPVAKNS